MVGGEVWVGKIKGRKPLRTVAFPGILFGGGGVQQIHLRIEDRENGDSQGFWRQL